MASRIDLAGLPTAARRAYRIVLVCGGLPLVAGTVVFLLWLVGRQDWLMVAGVFIIGTGGLLFVVGGVILTGFWALARRAPCFSRAWAHRMTVGAALLLLANFPVAAAFTAAAVRVIECYNVAIENGSGFALDAVHVSGGGCKVDFGRIAPGATRRRWFWIQREGELVLHATRGGVPVEEVVDGYVTGGMGARKLVVIGPAGSVSVTDANDRFHSAWYRPE